MNLAENRIQIGAQITGGLGSGGNPDLGRKACEESLDLIKDILTGYDMIFLAAGEGGGTGTGATPLIAEVAKTQGAIVIAVVTKPFEFEGKNRMKQALNGIENLKGKVDTLIVIPNQKLLSTYGQNSCFQAFRLADDVLLNAVKGISDLITQPGMINIDFADVRNVMLEKGGALISTGLATGEGRATEAAHQAIASPLIEETNIETAKKILLNISGDEKLTLQEVNEAATIIHNATNGHADIRFGATKDRTTKDAIRVTVVATGIEEALPHFKDVVDLLNSDELFPIKRRVHTNEPITIDKNNLEIPTFLRRQID
jgi:cell division protein FtsZ